MKHLVLLFVFALLAYFGWHYTPFRAKFFIKKFIANHLPWIALILGSIIALLFLQADSTTKLF
jgi:hypothetical protein